MRYFILFFLLAPVMGLGQECPMKKDRDPYTKEVRISTGFFAVGNEKVSIDATAKEIDMFFALSGGKCFDDASTAVFLFDSTRVKQNFKNSGTMNCEGYFHITFRNTPVTNYGLQRLMKQPISTIQLAQGKTVTTITLNEEQKKKILLALTCITLDAKTLIPTQ